MKITMNEVFKKEKSIHVLYAYSGRENYIKQVVNFIQEGIRAGDYVILIENDPVYRMVEQELKQKLPKEHMQFVHRVNSFDFYFSSGSYHPPAIVEYFNQVIQPYLDNNTSFRAWAHVEWASVDEPLHIIEDLERTVDDAVKHLSFPLTCAYESDRMPDFLKKILMETHPYILMEDDFIPSKQYKQRIDTN
ncbi:MEDS domain-containing protein [Pseudalkalibacillus berkeleyi]|uniref:MEDS domain-containing protein n=1 Tax=Pseudalkalibacillus berkeleyi TaxID=1069813 RepID=A0ABS9H2W3_9BACL|nr:MEDS domain-containing protein [Pseudalkalibacillus berkeleyi]MCF6139224.1 MEDS domain-containing protein [Pseudalkalibacillus berkeleyi]